MPLNAGALIDGARLQHAALTVARFPEPVALDRLQQLYAKAVEDLHLINPDVVATQAAASVPVVPHQIATLSVPLRVVMGGTVTFSEGDAQPLAVVSYAQRAAPPTWPACYVLGEAVFFAGRREDWSTVTAVQVLGLPDVDGVPAGRAVDLALPTFARRAMVLALAREGVRYLQVSGMLPNDADLGALEAHAQAAWFDMLTVAGARRAAQDGQVVDGTVGLGY